MNNHGATAIDPAEWRTVSTLVRSLLVLAVLLSSACQSLLTQERSFSVAQIQERVERRFPFKRSIGSLAEMEAVNPFIRLDEGRNRIALDLDLNLRLPAFGQATTGRTTLSGVPRYDANERAFVLSDPRMEALSLGNLPRVATNEVRRIVEVVVLELVGEIPVYTVKPEDAVRFGTELTARSIRVERDRVVVLIARR